MVPSDRALKSDNIAAILWVTSNCNRAFVKFWSYLSVLRKHVWRLTGGISIWAIILPRKSSEQDQLEYPLHLYSARMVVVVSSLQLHMQSIVDCRHRRDLLHVYWIARVSQSLFLSFNHGSFRCTASEVIVSSASMGNVITSSNCCMVIASWSWPQIFREEHTRNVEEDVV